MENFIEIITVFATVIGGSTLVEIIKGIYHRKSNKKARELENIAKQQEILSQKQGTVDEWERLSAQHNKDIDYYREELKERDSRITEKEKIIDNLREKLDETRTRCAISDIIKCRDLSCDRRIPKLGQKEIDQL